MRTWNHRSNRVVAGYSMVELALVMAIVGLLSVLATPLFLDYYQASRLRVAAEEVAAFVNQGRHIGIRENVGVCVHITPTAMHYHLGNCTGPRWVGPGTDATGNIPVPQGITLATTDDPPVFNYLGAATPAAAYTLTNAQDNRTLKVFVAASGRVRIGP